ncbi:MAG: 50S ribosomal protein L18 [Myxococcales bacterium]|nr:50S ribosomal protein L18 [Myxococcales bacterium]USN50904.1 MAG: 50S ribosomal protein L18 [Myxococcales bacterium]
MKYDLKAIGKKNKQHALHLRRKARIRKIISGTAERPRLSVFKTAKHVYVQAINDTQAITLASSGSLDAGIKERTKGLKKIDVARLVGQALGEKLKEAKLEHAVFDRNGFRYTGRIAAVADGIRSAGLTI